MRGSGWVEINEKEEDKKRERQEEKKIRTNRYQKYFYQGKWDGQNEVDEGIGEA